MTITQDKDIDIFVASKIGSFKHIKYHTNTAKNNKKCIENLVDIKSLQKDDTITCMQWGNEDQTEILIGRKNQQLQVFSTIHQTVTKTHTLDFAEGHIVGLGRCKRKLIAATASGVVRVWSKKEDQLVQTGGKLDVMRVCPDDPTLFATGGEENDVKIWRVGSPSAEFCAKNLPHDWLQLRRAVWVSGAAFAPRAAGRLLAACSRHGYVRLYDSRAQRRPVTNVEFPNMAATCIAPSFDEHKFLVGFGRGQLQQVDLRAARPHRGYKGCAGAVTDIGTSLEPRLVVSVSLDRHVRVHDYNEKELLYKQYLTSKLSCVLVQSARCTPLRRAPADLKEENVKEEEEDEAATVEDDLDAIFDKMETVGGKPKKNKLEATEELSVKKLKPSTEGSTEVSPEEANPEEANREEDSSEEAIVKLLRKTEKTKRQREKKKREKKAKSLFHNA